MTNLIRRTTTTVTTIIGTVTTTIVTARAIITNLITRTATKEVVATEMEVVKAEVVIRVAAVTGETTETTLAVVLHIRAAEVMTTTIVVHETTDLRAAPTVVETTGINTRAATAVMIVTYHVMVEIVATIEVAVTTITTTTTVTTTDKEATLPMTVQVVNNKIVDLNAVSQAMDIVADTEVVIRVVETMATVVATITTTDTTTTIRPKGTSTEEVTIASLPTAAVITRVIECKDVIRGVVADHQISNRTRLTRPLMNRKASENYEQNATYD